MQRLYNGHSHRAQALAEELAHKLEIKEARWAKLQSKLQGELAAAEQALADMRTWHAAETERLRAEHASALAAAVQVRSHHPSVEILFLLRLWPPFPSTSPLGSRQTSALTPPVASPLQTAPTLALATSSPASLCAPSLIASATRCCNCFTYHHPLHQRSVYHSICIRPPCSFHSRLLHPPPTRRRWCVWRANESATAACL